MQRLQLQHRQSLHQPGRVMNVLMLFIDGVGVGSNDPNINPFVRFDLPVIDRLLAPHEEPGRLLRSLDANLGVDGLPQSGTGQASLFTGKNCAKIAGRHYGPFPHSATMETIANSNIFRRLAPLCPSGTECRAFANAYPPPFFDRVKRRNRWTVTTQCCIDAKVRIRDLDDLKCGEALAADITGHRLKRAGFAVNPVSEADAAAALSALASANHFTLFEYFLTDKAGHSQSFDEAGSILESLDRFLGAVLDAADPAAVTTVLTSDHGNLEDLSTKSHTRNPVPLVVLGEGWDRFRNATTILDVAPGIVDLVSG